jgi:peptidyl-dipeptidase A
VHQAERRNFTTIYHELGHIYYDLAYNPLPPLFQGGANDGFHEAIGDTIVLAMTPKYLSSIGLVDAPTESREAVINNQMRMALSGVSFLPFGLMIDRGAGACSTVRSPPTTTTRPGGT